MPHFVTRAFSLVCLLLFLCAPRTQGESLFPASGAPAATHSQEQTENPTITPPSISLMPTPARPSALANGAAVLARMAAVLTVSPAPLSSPKITLQPASVASYTGVSTTFAVTATGNPAPTYQWRKDGTNIPSAISASYTIASVGTLDAGSYSVVASNSLGTVTSNVAVLTTKTIVPQKGNWRVLAGAPGGPGYADGTGSAARFHGPTGLAFDASGNLFVSNFSDLTIRKITPGGVVTTAAGKGYVRTFGALGPSGVAFDSKGTMYCAVVFGGLYKFDSAGKPSVIPTPAMTSGYPTGLAIDSGGNFFISSGRAIWKVSASGAAAVFAGSPDTAGTNDGNGTIARFSGPRHLTIDAKGNLYVADAKVRIISPGGNVTTLPGTYDAPEGVAVDSSGNVWITSGRIIQKITPAGAVTTIAGNKDKEGRTDGPGTAALFSDLAGIALDKAGNIFVADGGVNQTIRKITPSGVVSTFAGTSPIGSADGQSAAARFYKPGRIALDALGNILVADGYNHTIRKVTPAGAVTTLAGSPGVNGATDGVGLAARFNTPTGIAVDPKGNVFVTEHYGRKLRKILHTGSVTTVTTGYLSGVDVDSDGTVFFADQNVIKKISPTGTVSIFAGNLAAGDTEGFGASASFNGPSGLRISKNGDIFVADLGNAKIRRISSGGVVSTFSKGGYPAFWGQTEVALNDDGSLYALGYGNLLKVERDGSYTAITKPNGTSFSGVAVDANGNLVLSDSAGAKIWAATLADVPLKITAQPAATTADRGTAASFSVGATGSGPISYQWRRNGVEIPGATLPTLGIPVVQTSDAGSYDVVLANGAGAVVSAKANLTVTIPPDVPVTITTQPVGGSAYLGAYVSMSVQTTGTQPISYQWLKDGYEIPGATGSTYTITSAAVANGGKYVVTATNVLGTVTSADAILNVSPFSTNPIVITAQPLGALVVLGGPATFAVAGSLKAGSGATDPLTYQWRKDGVAIEGAVSPSYSITATQLGDSGNYDVLLSSGPANVVTFPATLSVGLPVSITAGPLDSTVNAGRPFELSVTPGGTGPFGYQWSKNGVAITKATASKLTVAAATLADAGVYSVKVRNQFGAFPDTPSALVTVKAPPLITRDPLDQQLRAGTLGTLNVDATGTAPIRYQWRRNGVPIPNETLPSYTLTSANEQNVGAYDVIVSNDFGTVVSGRASVSVNTPPLIVRQPVGATVQEGSALSLSVEAKGSGTLSYQWYKWDKAGKLSSVGNQAILVLGDGLGVTPKDAGTYIVTVTGFGPKLTSQQAVVNVRSGRGVVILEQPTDVRMVAGSPVTASMLINSAGAEVSETRYTLCRWVDGAAVATGIEGTVPSNGALQVPLRNFTDSRAVVQFTRTYTDATTATAQTQPFSVSQVSWADAAGSYEAVLLDMNSPATVGDGGIARGFITLNLTKTGAVSGRLTYVEAGSISGAPTAAHRAYQPVARSFTGILTPSQGESTTMLLRPKLGVGLQTGRQELALELDMAANPPSLKATVKDNASLPAPAFLLSRASNCTRSSGPLSTALGGLAGRYVLIANETPPAGSNAAENNAYLLAQVLNSGKVLWTTRLTGYSGGGSSGLNTTNPLQIVAPLFESRASAVGTQSSAVALFGRFVWEPTLLQSWNASISVGTLTNRLEKQASQLSGTLTEVGFKPVYTQANFDDRSNGTSVQLLDFRDQLESGWGTTPLSELFPAERALTLRLQDPLNQPAAELSWSVTVSANGAVRATGLGGANFFL
jgi:sugar lactone lactonase YvrE